MSEDETPHTVCVSVLIQETSSVTQLIGSASVVRVKVSKQSASVRRAKPRNGRPTKFTNPSMADIFAVLADVKMTCAVALCVW
jgi:hypothetical protein